MYAICVECSHQRGMGNLFRTRNILNWFDEHQIKYILLINNDERSVAYLKDQGIPYHTVDLWDYHTDWEKDIIEKYNVHIWINDRMNTDIRHAAHVKKCGVKLCSFDDMGSGAELVDQNFCPMIFDNIGDLKGKSVFTGIEYMVLNQEVLLYRKHRREKKRILVTLGGSDTYGVTVKVAQAVKTLPYHFTIVTGFCFEDHEELEKTLSGSNVEVKGTVPSLIKYFKEFDLAITGGGITAFEAVFSGLPCIIIANEHHEEQVGEFLKKAGCSEYLGYHAKIVLDRIGAYIENMNVEVLSSNALKLSKMNGLENTMREIIK
nr:hypothetical protein [uncultured Acetatifactor sp.]